MAAIIQLLVCAIAMIVVSTAYFSFAVFLPVFANYFAMPVSQLAWCVSILMLCMGLMAPLTGRLLDKSSVRLVLWLGALFLCVGFVCLAYAQSGMQVLGCYLLLGFGAAFLSPIVVVKHMTQWFPKQLGLATSLALLPLGGVLYPPLTQWLLGLYEWRDVVLIYAASATAVVILIAIIRDKAQLEPQKDGNTASAEVPSLAASKIYKALATSPEFWCIAFGFTVLMSGALAAMTHLVVYVQSKNFAASEGIVLLTAMGVASIAAGPLFGMLSDRFGPARGNMIAGLLQGTAFLLMLGQPDYWPMAVGVVVVGALISGRFVFFSNLLVKLIGTQYFGTGMGFASVIVSSLAALMPVVAGSLFEHFGSFDVFFLPMAIANFIVAIIFWRLVEPRPLRFG